MEIVQKLIFIDGLITIPIIVLMVISYNQKLAPTIPVVEWIITFLILKTGLSLLLQNYITGSMWNLSLGIWIYNYYLLKSMKKDEQIKRDSRHV